MISVSGRAVLGGEVELAEGAPLVVRGQGITAVRGPNGRAFHNQEGSFYPDPGLREEIRQSSGEVDLAVFRGDRVEQIRVHTQVAHLSREQINRLRRELGHLALSFGQHSLHAAAYAAPARGESREGAIQASSGGVPTGVENLFHALEQYLPPLLDHPLRTRGFAQGPVPLHRARPTPQNLLARRLRPEQRFLLGQTSTEVLPLADYAWLKGVVRLVEAHAAETARIDADIADMPRRLGGPSWVERLVTLQSWIDHPTLREITDPPSPTPSWVLGRSVPGAAILGAWHAAGMAEELEGAGQVFESADRLRRLPVSRDSLLYELWVLLGVVEILRGRFGFRLATGAPSDLRAYAHYHAGGWHFEPILLRWEGADPFGLPLRLEAEVLHEPALATREGGKRTPDVALRVRRIGQGGAEQPTEHLVDAKLRPRPQHWARKVARDRYLQGLRDRPTAVFVAAPGSSSDLSLLAADLSEEERQTMQTLGGTHGFAWGCLHAVPGATSFGIRQFVTLALQYHRWELRHLCSNCGYPLGQRDMRYHPTRREQEQGGIRAVEAHRDTRTPAGGLRLRGRLTYRCPRCDHTWSRQACAAGHLLMKQGRLTPHRVIDRLSHDPDYNVECVVCGHTKMDGRY